MDGRIERSSAKVGLGHNLLVIMSEVQCVFVARTRDEV